MDEEEQDLGALFNELGERFYELRRERFDKMQETLADISNYCEMQYIKLCLLQTELEGMLEDKVDDVDDAINLGAKAFQTSRDRWKKS